MRGDRGDPTAPVRVAVVGATALAVAMGIGRFALTPILPMMQQDSGVSVAEGGWLATANYAGYLAGAIMAGAVRIGPAAPIRLGLAGTALATLAMAGASGFEARLALRALAGISSAWVRSLARLASYRRPVLGGVVFAGVGIGIALAGGACLALMSTGAGPAAAWAGLGLTALIATAVIWRSVGADEIGDPGAGAPSAAPRRWSGEAAGLVCCYGAFGFGYIIPATFVPLLARQILPDPAVFGWCWPVFGAAAATSTLAAGAAIRRAGARRVWIVGQLVMALGVGLPAAGRGLVPLMLGTLLVGGTFMVNTMAGLEEARRLAAADPAPLIAALTTAFALGQIVGPALVSWRVGPGGDVTEPLLVAGLVLVGSAGWLAAASSRRRPVGAPGV
jgi:predicted MFS family arabinose efflux permease